MLLAVKDEGNGLRRRGRSGIGLHIMEYQTSAIRGSLAIHSRPGRRG